MSKFKPRYNPNKYQNTLGNVCQFSEYDNLGFVRCELGNDINICKGNPHNCCKVKYKKAAIESKKIIKDDKLGRK